jgi:chromosome segregation ATPase
VAVKRWSLWVAAIMLLGAAIGLVWQARMIGRQSARLAQLSSENGRLRQRVDSLSRQALPGTPAPAPESVPEERNAIRPARPASNPEDIIAIQRLKLSLADANASIARLQSHVADAEARIQNLTVDNKRLSGSEADLTQNLATANQAVDALQKELKSRNDHVTQIEIAYQKLRDQSGAGAKNMADLQQLARELQEIYQRREIYLNNILRRYRQITEQYRSISGVLDAHRTDAPGAGSADLARIQDSISMAEDDLRQLTNLNAQALRIQKKMAGK